MASTSQVSFASQNGPMEATMRSRSAAVGKGEQQPHAQIEPVEHDIDQDRQRPSGAAKMKGSQTAGSSNIAVTPPVAGRAARRGAARAAGLALGRLARQIEDHADIGRKQHQHRRQIGSSVPSTMPRGHIADRMPRWSARPCTSQGCRPISVVYQPASVATQPDEGHRPTDRRAGPRAGRRPRRRRTQQPDPGPADRQHQHARRRPSRGN